MADHISSHDKFRLIVVFAITVMSPTTVMAAKPDCDDSQSTHPKCLDAGDSNSPTVGMSHGDDLGQGIEADF